MATTDLVTDPYAGNLGERLSELYERAFINCEAIGPLDGRTLQDAIFDFRASRAEIERLRAALEKHNAGCLAACTHRSDDCAPYTKRGRQCPDCPKDWMIELPAVETFGGTKDDDGR